MSWYRDYRPTTISGLHLSSVRSTFEELLKKGMLPQVLLFAGAKGTGKTSTARILAAVVNDPANASAIQSQFLRKPSAQSKVQALKEPNLENELVRRIQLGSTLAVHELDAASHRGIDDVRQLKEQVAVPPAEGQVAVFILDEVHMLTTEAFNALLKLLEEPPAHVMFILATTELAKIPATVVSRCTLIRFPQATIPELTQALTSILKKEKVLFEEAALEAIAQRSDGSFRDAVKQTQVLVERYGELKVAHLGEALQTNLADECRVLVGAIVAKQPDQVMIQFRQWRSQAVSAQVVEQELCRVLHTALLQDLGVEVGTAFVNAKVAHFLLTELSQVMPEPATPLPLLPLELRALEVIFRAQQKKASPPPPSSSPASSKSRPVSPTTPTEPMMASAVEIEEVISEPTTLAPIPIATMSDNLAEPNAELSAKLLENWQNFVAGVKQRNSSLAAILGSAKPQVTESGRTRIEVYYRFHQQQLQQPKFFQMLQDTMAEVVGQVVGVEFVVAAAKGEPGNTLTSISPMTDTIPGDQLATLAAEALI